MRSNSSNATIDSMRTPSSKKTKRKITNSNNWKIFLIADYIETITSTMIHLWHSLLICPLNAKFHANVVACAWVYWEPIRFDQLSHCLRPEEPMPPTRILFQFMHKMNNRCNSSSSAAAMLLLFPLLIVFAPALHLKIISYTFAVSVRFKFLYANSFALFSSGEFKTRKKTDFFCFRDAYGFSFSFCYCSLVLAHSKHTLLLSISIWRGLVLSLSFVCFFLMFTFCISLCRWSNSWDTIENSWIQQISLHQTRRAHTHTHTLFTILDTRMASACNRFRCSQ